jgi:hypothetical protein
MDSTLSTVIVSGLGYGSSFGVFLLLGFANGAEPPPSGGGTGSTRLALRLGLGL